MKTEIGQNQFEPTGKRSLFFPDMKDQDSNP